MKKLFLLLMILISFSLFADQPTTGNLLIKGFFEESGATIIFKVWKESGSSESDRIYHSGDIFVEANLFENECKVFNWSLAGSTAININLKFTITPLQAYSNGTYYIPKHTVKMYRNNVLADTHEFSKKSSGSSSYPGYRQGSNASYVVNNAEFTFNETIVNTSTLITGYCTLQVLDYDDQTAGNFDYVSYITVGFETT